MTDKLKKLILIDGNAIIHRAYHALPPLTTQKGELVNAVYGFSSTVLSVIEKFKPDYIIATFDLAGPTFRHKEFEAYKAHRVKADQELYDQIPRVKEVVRAMGIPILEKEGFEADDVIGTVARFSEENSTASGLENIIVTGDLDTLQLVSPKTRVYTMRRGLSDAVLYGEEEVRGRYQLEPVQMIDYKGLRGDASDNIPGVKGIGEKTAVELLKKYGTLEAVYENINEIKGAVKEKLERDKVQAIQSKRLATIEKNVPVKIDLEAAKTHDFDREKLTSLFKELNFFSLLKRIPDAGVHSVKALTNARNAEGALSGVKDFKYETIHPERIGEFLSELEKERELSAVLKISNDNIFETNFKIQGVAISWKTGRAGYIAFDNLATYKQQLAAILENDKIIKIGYDLKKSIKALKKYGVEVKERFFDVMLAAYVLSPGGKIELSKLVMEELGEEMVEENRKGQLGLGMESEEDVAKKYCQLADYIFKLKQAYDDKIRVISSEQDREKNLEYVFEKMEQPLIPILAEMEVVGVRLNKVIFAGIAEKLNQRIINLEKNIYELAGGPFNINSPKQLTDILFEKLKLPTTDIRKGKTGYSTASSELKKIQGKHKIVEKIEEYREIFKLKTTYLDTLPTLCDEKSRIHTTFNQAVTATGRLSSSDPNLQNIPIRTDIGQILRTAFEAEKGWKLVAADYSQIDLRVVAHVSQDKKMIELFRRGEDIHRATAAEINKVSLSAVSEKMRSRAKALNFGVIYGMSVFGFSERTGVDRDEARKFIDAYFEKFEGVAQYMRDIKESVKKKGYVETEIGRRRYIPEINSPNFQVQNAAERMAINMPIQGLSADIVKLAMIKIYEEYKDNPDIKMILQVHDEIILEVKEEIAEEVGKKMKEIMESAYKLSVPLVVDVKVGDNWGEI